MTKKRSKKALYAAVIAVLMLALTGMGTLAYLTASQSGEKALVNTFVAAGGGGLIEDPTDLSDFSLLEGYAEYKDGNYLLNYQVDRVYANTYDKVMPGMIIPKDPQLSVNLKEGAEAYVFVKVTDTTAQNLTYTVVSDWIDITDDVTGLGEGEKLYVYKNAAVTGVAETELTEVSVLAGDKVYVADTLTDTDTTTDGMQLGQIKMEAYLCQAGGFTTAAEAFTTCFAN